MIHGIILITRYKIYIMYEPTASDSTLYSVNSVQIKDSRSVPCQMSVSWQNSSIKIHESPAIRVPKAELSTQLTQATSCYHTSIADI